MGLWTGIKYALNSTIGTSDFESLDQMIYGSKGLTSSQNLYATINKTYKTTPSNDEATLNIPLKIKFKWSGNAIFRCSGLYSYRYLSSGEEWRHAYLEIYKNDELYKTLDGANPSEVFSTNLVFSRGDVFTFKLRSTAGTINYQTIAEVILGGIYADILDTSGVKIEEV